MMAKRWMETSVEQSSVLEPKENKDYRRPGQYRRSEIEKGIQVEGRPEGGGPRQYRRAETQESQEPIQVEGMPEGGGLRQYERAEMEEAIQEEGRPEGGGPSQYKRAEI